MIVVSVCCPSCHSDQMVQRGTTHRGIPRSLCHHTACRIVKIFKLAFLLEVTPLPSLALRLVFRTTLTHTQRH